MTLSVLQGRALVFSPKWGEDGASVLFDSNSGDYWLLSPLAREIVRYASEAGPADAPAISCHIGAQTTALDDADIGETTIRRVIDELVQLSILAHT